MECAHTSAYLTFPHSHDASILSDQLLSHFHLFAAKHCGMNVDAALRAFDCLSFFSPPRPNKKCNASERRKELESTGVPAEATAFPPFRVRLVARRATGPLPVFDVSVPELENFQAAGLTVHNCRFYAAEMVLGLESMHRQKIIYRDLKPDNVLVSVFQSSSNHFVGSWPRR